MTRHFDGAALVSDEEEIIRQALTSAYSIRPMTDRAVLAHAKTVVEDKSVQVLRKSLENLWRARFTYPTVIDIVRKSAQTVPDAKVRKTASPCRIINIM